MIKNQRIINIQSHKDTTLEYCPGFNVIIGESNEGKSVIMKALNLIIENSPSIDQFRNWDCGKNDLISSEIESSEGISIARRQIKGTNEYTISGYENPFRGMKKNEVPEEVTKILNLGGINIQKQSDNFFLLNQKPVEVARYLNKLVDLDIIDTTTSNMNKRKLKVDSDLKRKVKELEEKEKELEAYDDIEELELILSSVEKDNKKFEDQLEEAKNLVYYVQNIDKKEIELSELQKTIDFESKVDSVLEIAEIIEENKELADILYNSIENLKEKEKELTVLNNIIKSESIVDEIITLGKKMIEQQEISDSLYETVKGITDKEETIAEINDILTEEDSVNEIISDYEKMLFVDDESNQLEKSMKAIKGYEGKLKGINIQIKEMEKDLPETCPLCKGLGRIK